MSRTVAEIEAEIASLKAAGEHQATGRMKALRAEKALAVAADAVKDTPSDEFGDMPAMPHADPFTTPEWEFIQRSIATTELEFKPGLMTGMAKKMFHVLSAKVMLWRMANDIVKQVGVGNEWPTWQALGRNDDTGAILTEKPAAPRLVAPPAPAPAVTEGGMPMVSTAPPMDQTEAMKQAIRGMVANDVNARPQPARAAVTA